MKRELEPRRTEGGGNTSSGREARLDALWLGAIASLFALLLISQVLGPLKGLTGDEPHYLVVAHSIVNDGDLDLRDDYAVEKAWQSFYSGSSLQPHYAPGLGGHYSTHQTGLAFYLVPFYWLGIAFGNVIFWVRLAMAVLWVAMAVNIYLLCRDLGLPRDVSVAAWLFAVFSVPLAFYSYSIYPEVPAALLAIAGLRSMVRWDGRRLLNPAMAGLFIALIPWLGVKYSAISIVAAASFLVMAWSRKAPMLRTTAALLAAPALALAGFAVYLLVFYGTPTPSAIYTGVGKGSRPLAAINSQAIRDGGLAIADRMRAALMYFFDQRDGILFYSPIYLFGIVGILLAAFSRLKAVGAMIAIFAAQWSIYIYTGWNSGHAPAGRPLVSVLWVLAVGMAFAFDKLRGNFANAVRIVLSAITLAFFVILVVNNHLVYHILLSHTADHGNNFLASIPTFTDLTQFFPNLFNPDDIHPLPTIILIALGVTLVLVLFRIGRHPEEKATAKPGGLMLAFCGGIPLALFAFAYLGAELIADEELQGPRELRLAFRDGNTYGFEPAGEQRPVAFWVRGGDTASVSVVCPAKTEQLTIELHSRVPQTVDLLVEGALYKVKLDKPRWQSVEIPGSLAANWMRRSLFRMKIASAKGFRPAESDNSGDDRYLGCQVAVSTAGNAQ